MDDFDADRDEFLACFERNGRFELMCNRDKYGNISYIPDPELNGSTFALNDDDLVATFTLFMYC